MRRKTTLIILIILFLAVVVYLFVFANKGSVSVPEIAPPKPDIPSYISGQLPIQMAAKEEDFDFPSKLPLVTVVLDNISKESAQTTAQNLGFDKEPEIFDDLTEGIKYYWVDDTHSLVVTPKTATIKYSLATSELPLATNKGLSDEAIITAAKTFLSESGILEVGKIDVSSITPYQSSVVSEGLEKVSRNLAQVFKVGFTYNLSQYRILAVDPSIPIVSVMILPDGEVFSAQATVFSSLSKGLTEYTLKNYNDIVSSLNEAKLMSLEDGYAPLSDLTANDLTKITVEKISLVYLLDTKQDNSLQPVYLLEGTVSIKSGATNHGILYLPAIK